MNYVKKPVDKNLKSFVNLSTYAVISCFSLSNAQAMFRTPVQAAAQSSHQTQSSGSTQSSASNENWFPKVGKRHILLINLSQKDSIVQGYCSDALKQIETLLEDQIFVNLDRQSEPAREILLLLARASQKQFNARIVDQIAKVDFGDESANKREVCKDFIKIQEDLTSLANDEVKNKKLRSWNQFSDDLLTSIRPTLQRISIQIFKDLISEKLRGQNFNFAQTESFLTDSDSILETELEKNAVEATSRRSFQETAVYYQQEVGSLVQTHSEYLLKMPTQTTIEGQWLTRQRVAFVEWIKLSSLSIARGENYPEEILNELAAHPEIVEEITQLSSPVFQRRLLVHWAKDPALQYKNISDVIQAQVLDKTKLEAIDVLGVDAETAKTISFETLCIMLRQRFAQLHRVDVTSPRVVNMSVQEIISRLTAFTPKMSGKEDKNL